MLKKIPDQPQLEIFKTLLASFIHPDHESHLKHDHRMLRNYLSGTAGDQINILLAAAAYNMKKWMRLKREEIINLIFVCFLGNFILSTANIKTWQGLKKAS